MIVLKFGGSSVANISRMRRIANMVIERYVVPGETIAIVTSAMSGATDRLNGYLEEMHAQNKSLEDDVVLSAGEPISTALLAIIFNDLGVKAQSFLGWQLPIMTDERASNARILDISIGNLHNCFDQGVIPIIAGFQGITEKSRITTLGRGGSDATAVALAAVLKAERCDIYTDVDGVYTADPKLVPQARSLPCLTYEEMFEMSFQGAQVLQTRSVEFAMKHHVLVRVLSSFVDGKGTDIMEKTDMEQLIITGITNKKDDVQCEIRVDKDAFARTDVLRELAGLGIAMDWFFQKTELAESVLSFLIKDDYAEKVIEKCDFLKKTGKIIDFSLDYDVAQISVIGIGIGTRIDVVQILIQSLSAHQIPILSIQSTPLSLRILTTKPNLMEASCLLHTAFQLENIEIQGAAIGG